MVGRGHYRRLTPAHARSAADFSRGGLNAADLCRSFGPERAVEHVNLQVHPGQIHALVGLNGAGKTTLMRLMLGMLRADRGSVSIFGRQVANARNDLWRRVGHMLDTAFGYPELTATENLRCAALLRGMPEATARAAVNTGISDLRLSRWADRPTRTLSTGNRQRLGLACAWWGTRTCWCWMNRPQTWTLPELFWSGLFCGLRPPVERLCWCPATTWMRWPGSPTRSPSYTAAESSARRTRPGGSRTHLFRPGPGRGRG